MFGYIAVLPSALARIGLSHPGTTLESATEVLPL